MIVRVSKDNFINSESPKWYNFVIRNRRALIPNITQFCLIFEIWQPNWVGLVLGQNDTSDVTFRKTVWKDSPQFL